MESSNNNAASSQMHLNFHAWFLKTVNFNVWITRVFIPYTPRPKIVLAASF
jgi:hypothetical protein